MYLMNFYIKKSSQPLKLRYAQIIHMQITKIHIVVDFSNPYKWSPTLYVITITFANLHVVIVNSSIENAPSSNICYKVNTR